MYEEHVCILHALHFQIELIHRISSVERLRPTLAII